ncbi:hypothetical protein CPJ18_02400 [Agrobacterium rosae]|uniref:Uncharacterized protein n=1 Tax=Agrobacterium rosae TaxID=1972867 RepID=A0AAE5S283_9HYPH|nr:hypothetical protein [Agrobacterium rosae]POO54368.1 hypothetical protein CPJ18_02400 [Agrobacterium rosae]
MSRTTYRRACALAEHYLAIGQRDVWLEDDDPNLPWDKVTDVKAGGGYRLNGPTGVRIESSDPAGLTFLWFADFESRDANGSSINQFDRVAMLNMARRLPPQAREKFAQFLTDEVLPAVQQRTAEFEDQMKKQRESLEILQSIVLNVGAAA